MLFRQRKRAGLGKRIAALLWPRRSFWRSANYFAKRILRLAATPHAIAAGVAAGVFASFTPFVGFHFIIAAIIAWCLRGNIIASALGTAVGNPITFPFIWAATLGLGRFVLSGRHPHGLVPLQLGSALGELDIRYLWEPLLKPMTAGGILLGILFGLIFYIVTRWGAVAFRELRRKRLAERTRSRTKSASPIEADHGAKYPVRP